MDLSFIPVADNQTDKNFKKITDKAQLVRQVIADFVDATAGAVIRNLPTGVNSDRDYLFVKTDASANHVEVLPSGTDSMFGTYTEFELTGQGSFVLTRFQAGKWYLLAYSI